MNIRENIDDLWRELRIFFINKVLLREFRFNRWLKKTFPIGQLVEDCRHHPCVIKERGTEDLVVISLVRPDIPESICDSILCGVRPITPEEAQGKIDAYLKDGERGMALYDGWTEEEWDSFQQHLKELGFR